MSLIDRKITNTDITSKGVVAAPDTMKGTAQENKMVFDRLIREVVKADLNGVIDDLVDPSAAAILGFAETEDIEADTIQDAIEFLWDNEESGTAKAIEQALKSEGYAVGKQDGVDVTEGSTYYHNNAKYYSGNADTQASNAASSASTATTKANEASASATSASNSATSAGTSASNAATSAEASATSASASATSASNAATSASQASVSETNAENAKVTALAKASEASISATNASASASNAATSATNASNSETAAASSATSAYTDAGIASASATIATTKASEATGAATTATGAATTATNASTNATAKALVSEGWANGKQNGVDVTEESPYYHNNAKYYADQAGGSVGGFVSYAVAQEIPVAGQLQARTNIGAYGLPSSGIPETDLETAVQESLGLADTSLQESALVTEVSASSTDAQIPSAKAVYDDVYSTLKEEKADKDEMSNRNYLDNPFFSINQREATTYTVGAYGVDRWKLVGGTATVSGNQITLNGTLRQILEFPLGTNDFKCSVLCASGTATATYDDTTKYFDITSSGGVIKCAKLELGSVSTLAMDTAPNYASELLKCQRYFVMFLNMQARSEAIRGQNKYSTFFLPNTLRTEPSISYESVNINNSTTDTTSRPVTSVYLIGVTSNKIRINVVSADIVTDSITNFGNLSFSADL